MNKLNPFYERNYICPICEMKFSSLSLRNSSVYIEKRESDFHNIYRGFNPLFYAIVVCPKCNYAASKQSFAKKLPPNTIALLKQALANLDARNTDFAKVRDLDIALESFQLAIRSAQLRKSGPGELAGLLHAAAWICREGVNEKLEKTYLEQARKHYQLSYEKSSSKIGNLSDIQASYLIGDLSLRLGQYQEAIKWFSLTIGNPNIKLNRNLENQTRDQWALAREMSKNQPITYKESSSTKMKDIQPVIMPASTRNHPDVDRNRPSMQMVSNLFGDQIDWLNQITNRGYDSSKKLVPREQVLRSLLDACMEYLNYKLPDDFSNEAELKSRWLELLQE